MPKNQAMPDKDTPRPAGGDGTQYDEIKGSESGGGAYPNPHTGKGDKGAKGFEGGQSLKDYHGPKNDGSEGGETED